MTTTAVVAGILLAACDSSESSPPAAPSTSTLLAATSTVVVASTTAVQIVATTAAASSTAASIPPTSTAAPTTTALRASGPLEFESGAFLGIRQGSLLPDAASALGVQPVRLSEFDAPDTVVACTGTEDPWIIRSGGLTLVFEEPPEQAAILTNWRYIGGPVAEYTEMVAPNGIRIGDTRDQLLTVSPDITDLGSEIDVLTPVYLRFGLENDTISYFGIIDCVFEDIPPD